jgi:DNA-binding transcriptional regulator YhcF (GntR family)
MKQRIRRDSPVPLYHQIAEALRNAIAVGELRPGARLPSVRDAAGQWGVNLHTVRKAYDELAREGLLRVRGARGTEVAEGAQGRGRSRDLDAFLDSCGRTAQEKFGISRIQLGQLLLKREAAGAPPTVRFLECSREQAQAHCGELMRAWRVQAEPLVLSEADDLPGGILIGTYFHYNDIRQRWPDRLDDVRFVAIAPDASLRSHIPVPGRGSRRQRLLICELDESKARNIAADLQTLFPKDEYLIEPRTLVSAAELPAAGSDDVVLVSPRVWSGLGERQRTRALQIRYTVRPHELDALGASFGWQHAEEEEIA